MASHAFGKFFLRNGGYYSGKQLYVLKEIWRCGGKSFLQKNYNFQRNGLLRSYVIPTERKLCLRTQEHYNERGIGQDACVSSGMEEVQKRGEENALGVTPEQLKALMNEVKDLREELKNLKGSTEAKMESSKTEIQGIKDKIVELVDENDRREHREKRCNIIIKEKFSTEDCKDPLQKVRDLIGLIGGEEDAVEAVYRLPKLHSDWTHFRVKMRNYKEKLYILKNKSKLIEHLQGRVIYIEDDFTKERAKIQKALRAMAFSERNKGKHVKLGAGKICIEGEWKNAEDLLGEEREKKESTIK